MPLEGDRVLAADVQVGDSIARYDGHDYIKATVTRRYRLESAHLVLETTAGPVVTGHGGTVKVWQEDAR